MVRVGLLWGRGRQCVSWENDGCWFSAGGWEVEVRTSRRPPVYWGREEEERGPDSQLE
jgi:hypothetical protein